MSTSTLAPGRRRALLPIPDGTPTEPCARCGLDMGIGKKLPRGIRRHVARHLCSGCYPTVAKNGELKQYERDTVDGEQWASRLEPLLAQGKTLTECAKIFDVSRSTLSSALHRSRAAAETTTGSQRG